MASSNDDFLARAEALGTRWRMLDLEMRALLAEAWDADVDVRPVRRVLVSSRRASGEDHKAGSRTERARAAKTAPV